MKRVLRHVPALVAAAGAALLVAQWAAGRSLWLDEELLAISLRDRGIANYAEPLWLGQSAPFGWLALQRLVVLAFGTGERALRAVPVLFGIATIATSVWIGRRWMTSVGAIALTLLCSFGAWLIAYFLEAKPYSADAFFALLLPAVAAWAAEDARLKRPAMFWIVAAIGQWFANGALFVTPACAIVLAAILTRVHGWRAIVNMSIPAAIWLGSFALNDVFVLRHAASSAYFHRFWAFAFPPPSAGLADTVRWFASHLAPFGVKPGGTQYGMLLWMAATAGFIVAIVARRPIAVFFATVPLSALLLAALHVVPFYERLALWIVPSLYIGVALLADEATISARRRSSAAGQMALAVAGLCVAAFLCGDVVLHGWRDGVARSAIHDENRRVDDRAAVRWLKAQKQPGDVWMTTHYGVAAVWWYAGIEGERIVKVSHQPDGPECEQDALAESIAGAPRVLLYLGFRFDDTPPGFDDLLVDRLSRLGAVTAYRSFTESDALVVDRRIRSGAPTTLSRLDPTSPRNIPPAAGCVKLKTAAIDTFVQ